MIDFALIAGTIPVVCTDFAEISLVIFSQIANTFTDVSGLA